ncbi:MAG: hypothetical protein CVT64_00695 [Actinobacteria bacterium HGW-Actinobacteria-4]|nr:MAG: hypothetical protein CVT64_00695 [Actinobacteria bacterium HGW-Actinobacteria-4]
MNRTIRTQSRLLAVVAAAALALAACGGSNGAAPIPPNQTPGAGPDVEAPAAPEAQGTVITVIATDTSLQLSESTFSPGTYTFVLENQGSMPHDLAVEGPGVDPVASPLIGPGDTTELTVELQAGTYELWCTVGNHRALGMEATINVA